MEETKKSIHIVSYPRSGSSYMTGLLSAVFNISYLNVNKNNTQIFKNHLFSNEDCNKYANAKSENFKKNNFVISILRNPTDTFASILCQELFFDKNNIDDLFFNKIVNRLSNESLVTAYESFWKYASTFSDLILNYDDINIYKDSIVEYISNNTGHTIKRMSNGSLFWDDLNVKDQIELKFLRSTKNNSEYNLIKEKLQNIDLGDCYNIYNDLLPRCKNFK